MEKILKGFKYILKLFTKAIILFAALVGIINLYMVIITGNRIISLDKVKDIEDVDYVIVLGASVHGKTPSPMLRDRIDMGVSVYNTGVAKKMLMSGDHSTKYYNEVGVMADYAKDKGVPEDKILQDHMGLCTYDTIINSIEKFGAKKVVIVTQKYHLYRAVYIAKKMGLDVYGVPADAQIYSGQIIREIREIAARCKDIITVNFGNYEIFNKF